MKKLIIVTMIAACVALCTAVWPHGNAVEETPVPAAETAVSAKEAPLRKLRNQQHWQRRKKERFRNKKRPKKSNLNRRQGLLKHP